MYGIFVLSYDEIICVRLYVVKPLNAELNPICHLLALLGAHHILHVGRIRVKHRVSCGFCATICMLN
jgi:hypothetical protein